MTAAADHHDDPPAAVPAPAFALPVDGDVDLVLREVWTARQLLPLIHANLEHLRAWEPWAHGDQTLEGLQAFTRSQLGDWLEGQWRPAGWCTAGPGDGCGVDVEGRPPRDAS